MVFADSRQGLEQAVERADGDDHLDEKSFEQGLEGLPQDGIAEMYVDVGALLDSATGSGGARRVEWLSAISTLGFSASVADDRVEMEVNLRTEGENLSEEDLPIAAGDEAPPIIERPGEFGFGIRNLAHVVGFAERAGQAVDPEGYGQYALAKETLNARLDIDIDKDLIGALSGNVSGSLALNGGFGIRAELEDPAAFEDTLAKAAPPCRRCWRARARARAPSPSRARAVGCTRCVPRGAARPSSSAWSTTSSWSPATGRAPPGWPTSRPWRSRVRRARW